MLGGPVGQDVEDRNLDWLAEATDGFSGADLMTLCKESAMRPLRTLISSLNISNNATSGTLTQKQKLPFDMRILSRVPLALFCACSLQDALRK